MPFSIVCPGCGSRLKAKDELPGRTLRCPKCRQQVTVPAAEEDASAYLLGDEPAQPIPKPTAMESYEPEPKPLKPPTSPIKRAPDVKVLPPLRSDVTPFWLRHLHWILILAIV